MEGNLARYKQTIVVAAVVLSHIPFATGCASLPRVPKNPFTCDRGNKIAGVKFCDGTRNCRDGSDEKSANFSTYPDNPTSPYIRCRTNKHKPSGQACALRRNEFCKGNVQCKSETFCGNCPTHFQCPNSTCWKRSTVCDGDPCNDCPAFQHWTNGHGFKCVRNGRMCNLPQLFLWDGIADCDDKSDLCYSIENGDVRDTRRYSSFNNKTCFRCLDNSMLVPIASVCDNVIDCPDTSDERGCGSKHASVYNTRNKQALGSKRLCDCFDIHGVCHNTIGKTNITCNLNKIEMCERLSRCRKNVPCQYFCPSHFQCPNSTCWERSTVCDGHPCNDCPAFQRWNNGHGFKCVRNGRMCNLPQLFLWDGIADCDDKSDLCYSSENGDVSDTRTSSPFNNQLCFKCKNDPMIISKSSVCNNVVDCPDMSDELLCSEKSREMLIGKGSKERCDCFDLDGVCHNIIGKTNITCALTKDEICDRLSPCDGDYPCEYLCPSHFQCPNSTCWRRSTVCDGDPCDDCPTFQLWYDGHGFRCPRKGWVCKLPQLFLWDGVADCDDKSDLCYSAENGDARDVRDSTSLKQGVCFQCLKDPMVIPRQRICDGFIDCPDVSDECFCQSGSTQECGKSHHMQATMSDGNSTNVATTHRTVGNWICSDIQDVEEMSRSSDKAEAYVLSSQYELIAHPFLRSFVWIMTFLSIAGNAIVLFSESKTMLGRKSMSASSRTNHLLVLNLSVSDLLMGVYLLMLGAAGARYSGSYSSHEHDWRSSASCTAMGVLALVSSETSVLTMVLLTVFRLYAVKKPFVASWKPEMSTVVLAIIMSWVLSLTIAFIPLTTRFEHFFETKAVMRENPFFDQVTIDFSRMKAFMKQFVTFQQQNRNNNDSLILSSDLMRVKNFLSWADYMDILKAYNYTELFKISGYLGYYSSSSVCICKLYVTTGDKAWAYSIGIVTLNFLAFMFVAVTYVWIYKKTNVSAKQASGRPVEARSAKQNTEMQKKIVRLIFTDFLCWIPISVMAFVNLGGIPVPPTMYAVSAIILLPINSSLNPLIYSNAPKLLYDRIRDRLLDVCRPRPQEERRESTLVIVTNQTLLFSEAESAL